jgi:hypothetical protein
MTNPTVSFIQSLILQLKSGKSVTYVLSLPENTHIYNKITHEKSKTHIEYELLILIQSGVSGFPILKPLDRLHLKAIKQLKFDMEQHIQKSPFLALIPLFLLQVPSLILIFLYPLISNFLEELS